MKEIRFFFMKKIWFLDEKNPIFVDKKKTDFFDGNNPIFLDE